MAPYSLYIILNLSHPQMAEREERHRLKMEKGLKECKLGICIQCSYLQIFFLLPGDPASDSSVEGDPFKTLFVSRIVSQKN